MRSLQGALGTDIRMYVLHDNVRLNPLLPKFVASQLPSARWDGTAEQIYSGANTRLVRRSGRGSARAMREAVSLATKDGYTYGFIHLDDHVYQEDFGALFLRGIDALETNPDLLWVRFSGYPLICEGRPDLEVSADRVRFDTVQLEPRREKEYTLWSSDLDAEVIRGKYWPVAMWFCIYRLDVLSRLLDWADVDSTLHLAHVELYFKQEKGFTRLREEYRGGRFGYINMQNGGIEMHRNANWRDLLRLPNEAIL
jgi:hypothetical protein